MQSQGIKIDIAAQIVGYQKSLEKLKQMAKNIDLGSALGKSISSAIKTAEGQLKNLQKNPMPTVKSDSQIDNIVNKSNQLGQSIANIGVLMQSITGQNLNFSALGEQFTSIISRIDELQGKLNESKTAGLQEAIKNSTELQNAFAALGVSVDKITTKNGGDILAKGLAKAQSEAQKLAQTTENAKVAMESQQKAITDKFTNNFFLGKDFDAKAFSEQISGILIPDKIITPEKKQQFENQIKDVLSNLNVTDGNKASQLVDQLMGNLTADPEKMSAQFKKFFHNLAQCVDQGEKELKSKILQGQSVKDIINSLFQIDTATLQKSKQQLQDKITQMSSGLDPKIIGQLRGKIDTAQTGEELKKAQDAVITAMHEANARIENEYKKATSELQELKRKYQQALTNQGNADTRVQTLQQGSQQYNNIVQDLQQRLKEKQTQIADLKEQIKQMAEAKAAEMREGTKGPINAAAQLNISAKAAADYKIQLEQVQAKQQMLGKIQGVVQRWFSIYAVIRMVSNAVKQVISTIKQLDTTITNIAIVTDMSQQDLWGQMGQYADLAKQYASSISGVYKVSQLYYQQGLQTNDVMALTQQTLKMARISGLDYQAATNYMTNAIRSFKMQMTDAQQVVDAYSAVAASSATSVSELATAMSKTASSAQAVGSTLQNTTAMMAVMIQATRESAENIGSAMKSIISRYGEMTSDPSKMTDSEGQEMSLNRVDKALKTVGITLQTAEGQFRNFDEVIMELAEKWDTIDTNTQRYIATIMAGNRQQSRFLALVSSYDRLKELTQTANDSEDASQLQYLKTLDSVDAKVQQLQTSLQSLYLEGGFENMYKGWLDFKKNIADTLNEIPKIADQPWIAVGKIGAAFWSLASVVTTVFKTIKMHFVQQNTQLNLLTKASMGEQLTTQEQARLAIILGKQQETQALVAEQKNQNEQIIAAQADGQNKRLQMLQADAEKELAIRRQQMKRNSGWGIGLSSAGLLTTTIASQVDSKNTGLKGGLTLTGGLLQGAGTMMMLGGPANPVAWIAGIATALPSIVESISIFFETTEEKIKKLKQAATQANNEAIKKKSETKSLAEQIASLRKLQEARYDSIQAQEEYYQAANKLGQTYPNLISSMDAAGNVTINLNAAEQQLASVRAKGTQAAIAAAKAQYEYRKEQENQAQTAVKKAAKISPNAARFQFGSAIVDSVFGDEWLEDNGLQKQSVLYNIRAPMNANFSGLSAETVTDTMFNQIDDWFDKKGITLNESQTEVLKNQLLQYAQFIKGLDENAADDLQQILSFVPENLKAQYKYFLDKIKNNEDFNVEDLTKLYEIIDTSPIGSFILDYIKDYVAAYRDLLLAGEQTKESKRAGIASIVGSQLMGKNGYATQMEGIEQILTNSALAEFERQASLEGGKDYNTWMFQNALNYVKDQMSLWNIFWDSLEESQKEGFNNLTKNTSIYSRTTFEEALSKIFPNLQETNEKLWNSIINSFYTEDTYTLDKFTSRYTGRENDLLAKFMSELIENRSPELFKMLGQSELKAINKYYDNIQSMIKGGKITELTGEDLLLNYIDFATDIATNMDLNSQNRQKVQAALYRWDGTLNGLIQIGQLLKDLGVNNLDEFTSYKNLKEKIPVNLVTQYSLLVTKMTGQLEDFQKALSNASKGMDGKTAIAMADKLGVTLTSFRFDSGKYYFDNIELIKEKYLTDYDVFLQQLENRYEFLAGTGIEGEGGILRTKTKGSALDPMELTKAIVQAEKASGKTAEEIAANVKLNLENLFSLDPQQASQLYDLYTQYSKKYEDELKAGTISKDTTLTNYIIQQLSQEKSNYEQLVRQYAQYQANSLILQTGNIEEFVKGVIGKNQNDEYDKKAIEDAIKAIQSGKFEDLDQKFSPYISELVKYYADINKSTYESMISVLEGKGTQAVKITNENIDVLKKILNDETLKVGQYVILDNMENIQAIQQAILEDKHLSDATRKTLLSQLHKSKYSTKISNTFGNLADNYRQIEYDTLLNIAQSLNMSIDDLITAYGLDLNEKTGKYFMTAEEAIRMARSMFVNKKADKKTYNNWIAQIRKTQRQESLDNVMQDIIPKRNELVQEDIQNLADTLGTTYDIVLSMLTRNSDGTYKMSLATIEKVMGKKLSDLPQKLLELVGEQIDNIISNLTGMVSDQSKGFTSIKSMQEYVTRIKDLGITQINGKDINLQALFEWNDALHAFVLTQEGIISQVIAAKAQLSSLDVGSDQYIAVQKFLKDTQRQFAEQIDVSSLMVQGKTYTERYNEYKNFEQAIKNYNAFLESLGRTNELLNAKQIKNIIRGGGIQAVNTAQMLAQISGKTLSRDQIQSFYTAQISPWLTAAEQILSGPGSIVSSQAAEALRYADANSVQWLSDGQHLVTSTVNLAKAYHYIYQQMIATNEATLADLNNIKALQLQAATGANVVEALGSAAQMTYTQFGQILTKEGKMLTEDMLSKLEEEGTLQQIGGGKIRITNFSRFADLMGWQQSSEQYISALKTYNQAMVDLNNKMARNIGEEVEGLSDLTGGEWLDVTDLWSELGRKESDYVSQREKTLLNMIKSLNDERKIGGIDSETYNKYKNQYTQELKELQNIPGSIKQLNDKLKDYGGYIENGILKTIDGANIIGIMQTIYDAAAQAGVMLQQDLAQLADAISEALKGFADNISAGLEGTLTNATKLQLQKFAKANFNIELKQSDFSKTTTGLKLSTVAATQLYYRIAEVDAIAGQIVFDSLRQSLQGAGQDCQNISKTMANIATLTHQIANSDPSVDNSDLQQRLKLYQDIAKVQMQEADQYDFMGRSLPDYLKGVQNYWNSVGKAYKVMNQAAQKTYFDNATGQKITSKKPEDLANATGYNLMGLQDFYNLATELGNLAQITGQPLMFFGQKIEADADAAAKLIEMGLSHLRNIDGEGVMVDLGAFAMNMTASAQAGTADFEDAIHAMADSQIQMLDSMIAILQTVVAMQKLGNVDTDHDMVIQLPEIFFSQDGKTVNPEDRVLFSNEFRDFADKIIKQAKDNEDLNKALNSVFITTEKSTLSLYELISDAADGYSHLIAQGDITNQEYQAAINSLYQMFLSGDYDPNNLAQSIAAVMKNSGFEGTVDLGDQAIFFKYGMSLTGKKDGKGNVVYKVDGKQYTDAKQAMEAYVLEQADKNIKNIKVEVDGKDVIATGDLTIGQAGTIQVQSVNGEVTYLYNGGSYSTMKQVTDAMYQQYKKDEINKLIAKAQEMGVSLTEQQAQAQLKFKTKQQWAAQLEIPVEYTASVITKNEQTFKEATRQQVLAAQQALIDDVMSGSKDHEALKAAAETIGIELDLKPDVQISNAQFQQIAKLMGLEIKDVGLNLITTITGEGAETLKTLIEKGQLEIPVLLKPSNTTINEEGTVIIDTLTATLNQLTLNTSNDNINWDAVKALVASTSFETCSGVLKQLILDASAENVNWNAVNALILSVPQDKRPSVTAVAKQYIIKRIGSALGAPKFENFPDRLTSLDGVPIPVLQTMCTILEITWGGSSATPEEGLQETVQKLADELNLDPVTIKAMATGLMISNGGILNDVQFDASLRALLSLLQSGGYTDQQQQGIALKFFASTVILSRGSGTETQPDSSITNSSYNLGKLEGATAIGTLLRILLNANGTEYDPPEGGYIIPEQTIKQAEATIALLKATFTATEGENSNYTVDEITGITTTIDIVEGVIDKIKAKAKDGAITPQTLHNIVSAEVKRVYGNDPAKVEEVTAQILSIILSGGGEGKVMIPDGVIPPSIQSGKTVVVKANADVELTNFEQLRKKIYMGLNTGVGKMPEWYIEDQATPKVVNGYLGKVYKSGTDLYQYLKDLNNLIGNGKILQSIDLKNLEAIKQFIPSMSEIQLDNGTTMLMSTYIDNLLKLNDYNIQNQPDIGEIAQAFDGLDPSNLLAVAQAMAQLAQNATLVAQIKWDTLVNSINSINTPAEGTPLSAAEILLSTINGNITLNPTDDITKEILQNETLEREINLIINAQGLSQLNNLTINTQGSSQPSQPISNLSPVTGGALTLPQNNGELAKLAADMTSVTSAASGAADATTSIVQTITSGADSVASAGGKSQSALNDNASALKDIPNIASRVRMAAAALSNLGRSIQNIPSDKKIRVTATIEVKTSDKNSSVKGQIPNKDKQIPLTMAKGNIAFAGGTKTALMGELGPQLVVSNGQYNVVGQNGAEMIDLPSDAIVFNHLQTKKLLGTGKTGRGKPITSQRAAVSLATGTVGPAFASASAALAALKQIRAMWQAMLGASAQDLGSLAGKQAAGDSGGGGGGGGNKDKEVKTTTAEIERWYNLTRQIDKLEQDITHQQTLRDKLESDRIANGQAIYNSRRKQLENLMEQITATKELIYLQKSWYDRKRAQLAASTYGNIFTYDENGLQQYTSGLGKGLDVLEKLTTRDVNGKITGWAESADKQIQYLKSIGFDTEVLKYNDDGTVIDFKNKGDKSDNELYMQMMQNFWDGVDGWKETLDSLYDSYRQSTENILSLESDINGILEQIVDNQRKVEDAVVKAIEDRQKEIIDKLQNQRDAIEKSSQKYLKGLQDQLEREQQMYQDQKEDKQIDKLRRQILILQRTGGSASEISSLQQQLDEKQRDSYFNMQQEAIDAMQQASDAQLQRLDAQLDVMNETLQYQKEHGLLWEEVTSIMSQDAQDIVSFLLTNTKDYQSYSALQLEEQKLQIQKEAQQWVGYRKDLQPFWSKMNDTIKEAIEGSADIGWRTTDAAMQSIFGENWDKQDPTVKDRFDEYVKGTGDDAKAQQQTIKDLMPKKPEKQQSTTTQQTTTGGGSSGHGTTVIRGSRTQGTRAGTTQTPTIDTSLEDKAAIIPESMKQSFKRSLRGADTLTQTLNDISNLTDNIKGTIENDVINNNQRNMVQDTTINFNIQSNDAKNVAREIQNVLVRQGFRSGYRQV